MSEDIKKKVVIIGAGISGLSAAKLLKEQGYNVTVLEAQERVGGRTHTLRDEKRFGGYTDVGGAYVGPTQRRVARLAKELGLEFYKVDDTRHTLIDVEGIRMKYVGATPPLVRPFLAMDLNYIVYLLEKMILEVPHDAPWTAPRAKEWDSMTFKEFLDKNCWTKFTKELMSVLVQSLLCVEPHEVSLLSIVWYFCSGHGFFRMTAISNSAQERKFVGGAMSLSEKLAERVGWSNIKLNQPVIRVEQTETMATVSTSTGDTYKAQYIISALPLSLLNRVCFDPPLHPLKIQLIQRIPMGSIIKTMMFYKTAFWREKGLCGVMGTNRGPVLVTIDDTKPDGSAPAIMGFIHASQALDMVDLTPEQRKEALAKHYADVFRCEEFLHPVDYAEKNWMAEQYSGGCYVSVMPPGVLTKFAPVMREPHQHVYFAGTETASRWSGYMDGAIQAGERAARQILHAQGDITSSDIDQEEPPVDYFPEPPVQILFLERVLPSVGTFLWICGVTAAAVLAALYHKFNN